MKKSAWISGTEGSREWGGGMDMKSGGFRGLGSEPSTKPPVGGEPPSSRLTDPDKHCTPGRREAGWAWMHRGQC